VVFARTLMDLCKRRPPYRPLSDYRAALAELRSEFVRRMPEKHSHEQRREHAACRESFRSPLPGAHP